MNNLDKQYTTLLQDILDNGVTKQDRTGTGTLSVFGRQIRHKMSEGFPLLTTKKMPFRLIATELMWFLRGDTNIKYLVDNDCHIWDGDAYKRYADSHTSPPSNPGGPLLSDNLCSVRPMAHSKESFIEAIKTDADFAKKWGELGPIYGKQWRSWEKINYYDWGTFDRGYRRDKDIDQIQNLINDLKTNPDSRRLMVSAWNVGELDKMTLPPCHYGFQVYTRELSIDERESYFRNNMGMKDIRFMLYSLDGEEGLHKEYDKQNVPCRAISLMWNQRSVDTFLGLPFNIASYGLLLEIIAKEVNMVPDELIGNLGDTHLYLNHIEQAKEQIGRELSLEERFNIVAKREGTTLEETKHTWSWDTDKETHDDMTSNNVPKRTRQPYPLPKLFFKYEKETYIDNYELDGFILKDYQSHPHIKAPLSN